MAVDPAGHPPDKQQPDDGHRRGLLQLFQRNLIADEYDFGMAAVLPLPGDDQTVFAAPVEVDRILFHNLWFSFFGHRVTVISIASSVGAV